MKRCSTCNRTYDDTFSFCVIDGMVLSAPYNTESSQESPASGKSDLPPTEVLHDASNLRSPHSTIKEPLSSDAHQKTHNQQPLSKSSNKLWIAVGGAAVVVITVLLVMNMSGRRPETAPDTRPTQNSQVLSTPAPSVPPAKVEKVNALRAVHNYKIGIYFPNRVAPLSNVAKDIQKKLMAYGFKNIQTYGEDDLFFEKVGSPSGDEIRYELGHEDEAASALDNVLREIYPQRSFRKQEVEGRTEKFISIFLGSESGPTS